MKPILCLIATSKINKDDEVTINRFSFDITAVKTYYKILGGYIYK